MLNNSYVHNKLYYCNNNNIIINKWNIAQILYTVDLIGGICVIK